MNKCPTMKSLTLIRHAKSDQHTGVTDIERPLNARGLKDAPRIGQFLQQAGLQWDWVFISPAQRAQTTAKLILAETGQPDDQQSVEAALYTFDADDLYRFIEGIDDRFSHVALVGHNPAITLLSNALLRSSIDHNSPEHVPTCGVVELQFDSEQWVDIAHNSGQLLRYTTPKQLT